MADDEGAAYWEGVYGQPIHVYGKKRRKARNASAGHGEGDGGVGGMGGVNEDGDGDEAELEEMTDEEYTTYVRQKMWEKTHQHILEERKLREERARRKKEEEKERSQRVESEREKFERDMEESLKRGVRRKRERDWRGVWGRYCRGWECVVARGRGRRKGEGEVKREEDGDAGDVRVKIENEDEDEGEHEHEIESADKPQIPWPTKSGKHSDISTDEVETFFRHAPPADGKNGERDLRRVLKLERVRWHPDRMSHALGGGIDDSTLQAVTAVFQVVDAMYGRLK